MSSASRCFFTCIQVSQKTVKVVWYSYVFKNFPQFVVIHTVKGFSIVNEAEVDDFLEFPCLCYDAADVGNLISGSSGFSKPNLYIWKFSVHILLKPSLKYFERYFASMWNEGNCRTVWTFFGIAHLWDCNEKWPFSILWSLLREYHPSKKLGYFHSAYCKWLLVKNFVVSRCRQGCAHRCQEIKI